MLRGTVLNKQAVPGSIGDLKGGIDGSCNQKMPEILGEGPYKQGILQEMVSKITVALRRPILSVRAPPINAKKTCSRKPSERVVPISRLESPIFRI